MESGSCLCDCGFGLRCSRASSGCVANSWREVWSKSCCQACPCMHTHAHTYTHTHTHTHTHTGRECDGASQTSAGSSCCRITRGSSRLAQESARGGGHRVQIGYALVECSIALMYTYSRKHPSPHTILLWTLYIFFFLCLGCCFVRFVLTNNAIFKIWVFSKGILAQGGETVLQWHE